MISRFRLEQNKLKKIICSIKAFLLVLSLLVFIPLTNFDTAAAAPVGACDSFGSVTENENNGFYIVKFELTTTANTNGNDATCSYTVPAGVTQVEFLSVSGGGGGGKDGGGGGGGGGVLYYKNWNVTPGDPINLTVGAGGAPATGSCTGWPVDCPEGGTGNTSVFAGQYAQGGGGGGGRYSDGVASQGSGGGAGHTNDAVIKSGGNSTGDSDIFYVTYGNDGGSNTSTYGGGGGGSATNTGSNTGGVGATGGAGGNGFASFIEGTGAYYGGGGGGGTFTDTAGVTKSGGSGGGGAGGNSTTNGTNGTNGTGGGGGGGGAASTSPGRGGGGVVIVRYQNSCSISSPTTYNTGVGSNSKNRVVITSSNTASSCTGNWTVPANVTSVEVFLLAGGGGGGGKLGAGGGSGGAINNTSYSVTAGGSVAITVGGGGRGGYGQWDTSADNGANSIFGNLKAYGGGEGGDEDSSGVIGGSGGGAGGGSGSGANAAAPRSPQADGTGTKYGNGGGAKSTAANAYGSGGGGGLGAGGGNGSSTNGGTGGAGISIYGYALGGGGGGGVNIGTAGSASNGGGAGSSNGNGVTATASTGGGGGGGSDSTSIFGGDGGSGIIIILYATNLTLTFNSNYGTPTTSTQTIPANTSTNLTANSFSRTGYTFANWNTQANGLGTTYANTAVISISTATTLYAQWSANTLTITYDTRGGSAISDGSTTTGGSISASPGSPTRAGYRFLGWATASYGTLITFPYTHNETANFTLYAQWSANSLTITYDTQGGSSIPNGSVLTGSYINPAPATPTWSGYTFNGWFVAPTGGTAISNFSTYAHNQTSNFTLYAQWTAQAPTLNSVTVTGSAFSGSVITATPSVSGVGTITYTYQWYRIPGASQISGATSSTYTLTDTDLLGYVYVSVVASNESASSSAVIGSMPSTPKIGVATPTITGYLQRGQLLTGATSSTIPAGATVVYQWQRSDTELGSYTSISGATSSTYTLTSSDVGKFIKLSITISNTSQGVASNPSISNATNVIIDSYTISYAAGGGSGSGPTSPASVINGATFSVPANTFNRAGYTFAGWSDGTNTYQSGDTYPAAAGNVALTATWSANTLNITYDANGGTTPAGGSATTTSGSTISTLATTGRSGYTFNGWFTASSGGTQISTSAAHNQTSNFTLYAQWSANSLTITYDSQEGSAISSGSTTTDGSIASSPGTPTRAGYTFNGWFIATSGGSAIDFPYAHSQNANFTLYAQWSANTLNITYDANGGTTPAGGTATTTTGSTISTLATSSRSGYTFNGWFTSSSGGSQISTSAAHNQTSNFTLYAQWSANTLNITYDANGGTTPAAGSATTTTGSTISTLATSSRSGYTFNGWFTSSLGGTQISTSAAHNQTASFTLYAQWSAVVATPTISSQPQSASKYAGQSIIFSVSASVADGGLLSYQWRKNGSNISGAQSDTYSINPISASDAGDYTLVITNSLNGGSASITSNVATLTFVSATQLSTPNTPTVSATASITTSITVFYTTVSNASSYTVKVYQSGSLVGSAHTSFSSGATISGLSPSTTYTVTITAIGDDSVYSNSSESSATTVTTNAVAVTPTISSHPSSFSKISGQSVTFSVTASASDSGELSYQWYVNSLAISGATSATLTISNLSSGNAGDYTVVVTNSKNSSIATASSNVATLTITIQTYTVTYTAPDKDGGSVPVDSAGPYTFNTTITLPGNTGSLTRGSYVFAGWRTAADATVRGANSSYSVTQDTTFIAVWSEIYQVSFNANGASGSMSDLNGPSVTIPSSTFTRTGYTFSGWNSSADGSGFPVSVGITVPVTVDVTLYAQWSANTLNITYDANGGSTPAGGSATTTTGSTISTLATTSRSGYTFNGWFTASSGGSQITTSAAHNQTASFTLYAQWSESSTANVITFTSISNQSYGATLDLSGYVSASSGLTVSLSSATTAVCTISTTTVTAIAVGTCTITAAQAGNGSYVAANNVSRSFTVGKKALTITIGTLSATVGGAVSDPSYSQSGLVTSFGDAISAPTYKYQGKSGTYYPISTSKPSSLGSYRITTESISLSSGSLANYEVTITNGELSISGVSTNQVSGISIKRSSGDKTTELLTGFSDATTSYTIYLEADISAVTATVTRPAGSLITAQIKVNNSGWRRLSFASNISASGNLPIPVATNTISILTTATDQSNRTFTITIFRDTKSVPSGATSAAPTPTVSPTPAAQAVSAVKFYVNNATGIASGSAEVALTPSFATGTLSYAASFTNKQSATIMQINFTAAGVNLRLKVNNGPFRVIPAVGSSNTIALNVGSNTALLRVFSTDGTTVDYTFTLTRAAATP